MSDPSPSKPARSAGREPRFPRWLLVLGVPLATIVLVVFFVFLQFPFDRFKSTLARQAGVALDAEVDIAGLEPSIGLTGPAFVASDVRIRFRDGRKATISRAKLRPAVSASWLAGEPAFHVDADSDLGAIDGAFAAGDAPSFDGELRGVALGELPLEGLLRGAQVDGELDLTGDVVLVAGRPVGQVKFASREGSVAPPRMPLAVPYDRFAGELIFAEDGSVTFEDVALDGPLVSATVKGGTGPSPTLLLAPLQIDVHLSVSDPNLRPAFRSAGIRLGQDGTVDLKIRGNLAAPVVR